MTKLLHIILLLVFVFQVLAKNYVRLNTGYDCPLVGIGMGGQRSGGYPTGRLVSDIVINAVHNGYRHIDTAFKYGNEREIGRTVSYLIHKGMIRREDIFITTKVSSETYPAKDSDETVLAIKQSKDNLNLTYIDLVLVHCPSDVSAVNKQVWKGMEEGVRLGLVRSIGLSRVDITQLEDILNSSSIPPAMVQVESHPKKNQRKLIDYCHQRGIRVTAFSPLGSGSLVTDPTLVAIGEKYGKSAAQVMIRWQIQRGVVVIPKSTKKERIEQNINVFDFEFSDKEMNTIENMR